MENVVENASCSYENRGDSRKTAPTEYVKEFKGCLKKVGGGNGEEFNVASLLEAIKNSKLEKRTAKAKEASASVSSTKAVGFPVSTDRSTAVGANGASLSAARRTVGVSEAGTSVSSTKAVGFPVSAAETSDRFVTTYQYYYGGVANGISLSSGGGTGNSRFPSSELQGVTASQQDGQRHAR